MSWDPAGLSQNRAVIPTGSVGFIAIIALSLTDSLTSQNSAQELLERLFSSLGTQCRGFTEPFHVQHKDWAHVGAAPAHPQHHHEMLGQAWSQINHGGTKPMPVPQSCQPTCACTASKHQAGQEIQENGMVAAGMSVGQCCSLAHLLAGCPCWLAGKARLWRTAPKWGDSPLTQPLGTPLARPEMGRSWLPLQVHNQPGQSFDATCGLLLPIPGRHQGEEPTPKPAWPWAVGSHRAAAPVLCSQPARS